MNFSLLKLCLQLSRYSSTKSFLSVSKNHWLHSSNSAPVNLSTRTVLPRPKELDVLKSKAKEHKQAEPDGSNRVSILRGIDGYGYFLIV